ncbi:MAG TPA: hypothetical protein P5274_00245 [Candidatus Paceibacterota bacterium]|nr:hypothetical protein [Candidatus Paceibacterota bacterium]
MKKEKVFNFIRKHRRGIIIILLLLAFVLFFNFLTKDRQSKLPYRVSGQELLQIKEKCKKLAEAKTNEWNNDSLAYHNLDGYGYSEYRGTCYAEIIRVIEKTNFKILYDTVEEKQLVIRRWSEDIGWYNSDFDKIILGKHRILDFRAPF